MKETKRVFVQNVFYDRTGIRKFLESQAQKGWLLKEISNFGWIFKRIEPRQIHYEVTYFPKASAFDPEPSEKQRAFQDFCAHTGWELAAANAQMQIFYNERENPTPIETDAALEVETIHAAVKKGYLPSNLMLMAVGILQAILFFYRLSIEPVEILASKLNLFTGFCWAMVLIISVTDLVNYFAWYRKARRAAETDGSFVETRGMRGFHLVALIVLLAGLGFMLLSLGNSNMLVIYIATVVLILVFTALLLDFSGWMKRKKVSAGVNRTLTIGSSVLMGFGMSGIILWIVIRGIGSGWLQKGPQDSYEFQGRTYYAYIDELPLTVGELTGAGETEEEHYSYRWTEEESFLLGKYVGDQSQRWDSLDWPGMSYTIVEVKWQALYDWCVEVMQEPGNSYSEDIYGNITYDEYHTADAAPWGARAAYRLYHGEDPRDQYLICYEDRIIELEVDWEMTEEQMKVVGEKLGVRS